MSRAAKRPSKNQFVDMKRKLSLSHCYAGKDACVHCKMYETQTELIQMKEFHTNKVLGIFFFFFSFRSFPVLFFFLYNSLNFEDTILSHVKEKYPQGEIEVVVEVPQLFYEEFVSVWDRSYTPIKKRRGYFKKISSSNDLLDNLGSLCIIFVLRLRD